MEPTLPRIADGERITGDNGLGVTLLADLEQLGVAGVRSAPGGVAPPPHVHERHAEAFLVLAGELTFLLEDGEHVVRPETWVFVPPGVVHTFAVTGEERAHFLDFHAPSCGTGDFVRGLHAAKTEEELREVRAAFDQVPAPDGGGADPGLVVVTRAGGAEGETIGGRQPNRRATLLVDTDELTVTEFAYGPGKRGADLHVHHDHADAFLVVEGELALHYRDGTLPVPAGSLVLLPRGVVHGFDNGPSARSRFYNLHLPASGFADYMRGRNPAFDQHDPPADGGVDPASIVAVRLSGWVGDMTHADEPIVLGPGEGERLGGSVVKAAGSELSLLEFELQPGGEIAPHLHRGQSDSFYVLEGEVEFRVGDRVVTATPGAFVLSPAGVVHSLRNPGEKPARLLNLHMPGGFVEYRRELAALHAEGMKPDREFFERYDVFDP